MKQYSAPAVMLTKSINRSETLKVFSDYSVYISPLMIDNTSLDRE